MFMTSNCYSQKIRKLKTAKLRKQRGKTLESNYYRLVKVCDVVKLKVSFIFMSKWTQNRSATTSFKSTSGERQ